MPLFAAAVGIIFRGAAFAMRGEAATISEARLLGAIFAVSSLLTPFFLGCAIGAVASGQVPAAGNPAEPFSSWTDATSILIGMLAVAAGAYIAAIFLAADAAREDLPDLVEGLRRRALGAAVVVGAIAIGGLAVIESDAPACTTGLTSGGGLAMVIVSALLGTLTIGLVWTRRFELARYSAGGAVGTILVGWAFAQSPYLLPGQLTLDQAAAGNSTLIATLIAIALALAVIVPSLALLYRLKLRGRTGRGVPPDRRVRARGGRMTAARLPKVAAACFLDRLPARVPGRPGDRAGDRRAADLHRHLPRGGRDRLARLPRARSRRERLSRLLDPEVVEQARRRGASAPGPGP